MVQGLLRKTIDEFIEIIIEIIQTYDSTSSKRRNCQELKIKEK